MKYLIIVEYEDATGYTEEKVYDLCCSIGHTEQLTPHSFILSSELTAVSVRDAINNSPYEITSIFVSSIQSTAAWRNAMCENTDLKAILNEQ